MAEKQICPHCGEGFNDDDLREFWIRMEFEQKYKVELVKIRRLGRFFKSGWMVVLIVILVMFMDPYPATDPYLELSPWLLSAVTAVLVAMFYVPYLAGKKEGSLFSKYKKEVNA